MAEKRKVWRVIDNAGTLEQVLVETSAEQVTLTPKEGVVSATNVQTAIEEIANLAATGGVTGVKGSAESVYRKGNVEITKANIGLGNVDNTADTDKPVSTAQQTELDKKVDKTTTVNGHALSGNVTVTKSDVGLSNVTNDAQVKRSEMGVASGVATLDTTGKVPTSQLPSYVDDVLEYTNKNSFPATGETGKIYVDTATNKTYRWSGTAYTEISASLALGETSSTAYAGDKGKANADAIAALQTRVDNVESKNTSQDTAIQTAQNAANAAQTTADEAKSAAATNAGAIDDIVDGTTTVKKAESATSSTTATKLSAKKTFSLTGNVTGSVESDLSGNVSIATTIEDGAVTTAKLSATGIAAGTYTALTVDNKGRATAGGTSIEFGTSGQTEPSANLMVGGLFFQMQ